MLEANGVFCRLFNSGVVLVNSRDDACELTSRSRFSCLRELLPSRRYLLVSITPTARTQVSAVGGIKGAATDQLGRVVPNAEVRITNVEQQDARVVNSNAGFFCKERR
jgi:hypothetical protein